MELREIVLRIVLSIVVGGVIGYEREHTNSPAGFRTHILVAVGATIISLIQVKMYNETIAYILQTPEFVNVIKIDMGRLGAQVVSGIGFLGAGTILHTKGSIRGLTTAASIWVVGCIGLAVGMGYYDISILATITTVVILVIFKQIEKKILWTSDSVKIYIEFNNKEKAIESIEEYIMTNGIKIHKIDFNTNEGVNSCTVTLKRTKTINLCELMLKCSKNKSITRIYELDE